MTDNENAEAQIKSKKPSDSAFKQQRLPAWQPVLTAGTVLPTFFIIGIAFIPVGVALLYFSDQVKEHIIDYTDCNRVGTNETCADYLKNISTENRELRDDCQCVINFTLTEDFKGNVYMYYGLTNYYQNHRRYVKSRDDDQLLGRLSPTPSSDCAPFDKTDSGMPIAPCGAIANSLFNDSLTLSSSYGDVTLLNTGIAWPSDKKMKFKNPDGDLETALRGYAKPIAWSKNLWQLDEKDKSNNGFQNEDLIVWMRTAALPSFRKLYRRIDHSQTNFVEGLPKGNYTLKIDYRK